MCNERGKALQDASRPRPASSRTGYLMNKKLLVAAAVISLAAALVSVAALAPQFDTAAPGPDRPELRGLDLALESISPKSATERAITFRIAFQAVNPDPPTALLQYVKYTLVADGKRIHAGLIGERPSGFVASSNFFTMLQGAEVDLADEFSVRNTGADPELWESLRSGKAEWSVSAEASYSYSSVVAGGERLATFDYEYVAP